MNDTWKNGKDVNARPARKPYNWKPDEQGYRIKDWTPPSPKALRKWTPSFADTAPPRPAPPPSYPFEITTGHRLGTKSDALQVVRESAALDSEHSVGHNFPMAQAGKTYAPKYDFSKSNGHRVDDEPAPLPVESPSKSSLSASSSANSPYTPSMGRPGTRMVTSRVNAPYDFAGTTGHTIRPGSPAVPPVAQSKVVPDARPPPAIYNPQMGRAGHIIKPAPAYNFEGTSGRTINSKQPEEPAVSAKTKVTETPEEQYSPLKPWLRKRGNAGAAWLSSTTKKYVVDMSKGKQVVQNSSPVQGTPAQALSHGLTPAGEAKKAAMRAAELKAQADAEAAVKAKARAEAQAQAEATARAKAAKAGAERRLAGTKGATYPSGVSTTKGHLTSDGRAKPSQRAGDHARFGGQQIIRPGISANTQNQPNRSPAVSSNLRFGPPAPSNRNPYQQRTSQIPSTRGHPPQSPLHGNRRAQHPSPFHDPRYRTGRRD